MSFVVLVIKDAVLKSFKSKMLKLIIFEKIAILISLEKLVPMRAEK